ncbi:Carboxylesterase [Bertholletia excelsa]
MAAITLDPSLSLQISSEVHHHGDVVEEIDGLIRVFEDGHVERTQIVPCVGSSLTPEFGVTSRDVVIDKFTNVWARLYMPRCQGKLPLIVYFHGGGFCVGSAAWSCYHEFLAKLAASVGCLIMSVNYSLAPENPLPAAYEDGFRVIMWVRQQALGGGNEWWSKQCYFNRIYLAGDSAGANIAHNVAIKLGSCQPMGLMPLTIMGTILIQPFFGGEARTNSEKYMAQPPRSALSLVVSDTYWRLALPSGVSRDHPWCNPLAKGSIGLEDLTLFPTMVCLSDMDILRDRNLEFCAAMAKAGKKVEYKVYEGVGHAFQILNKSQVSQNQTNEMISHIRAFISS